MSKEFKIGLLAIIAGVLFYFGFNYLKGIDFFSSSYKYYAVYENVNGLTVSNLVIVNGFAVGRVNNIELLQDKNNQILVEMMVNNDLTLNDSTVAHLTSNDLFGSKGIVLEIGDGKNPKQTGDTLMSSIDPGIMALLESTQPVADNLTTTIRRLNEILLGLKGSGEKFNNLLANLNQTTENVNSLIDANERSIALSIDNLNKLLTNLDGRVNEISVVLNNFNGTLDSLNQLDFANSLENVDSLVNNLNYTITDLSQSDGTINKLFKEDKLYQNLNTLTKDLDSLINHINYYPKHFFSPLGKKHRKIKKQLNKEEK